MWGVAGCCWGPGVRLFRTRTHTHTHTHTHSMCDLRTYVRMLTHTYVRSSVYAYVRVYVSIRVPTYMRTYMRPLTCSYLRTYVKAYVCTYVRTYVTGVLVACLRLCLLSALRASLARAFHALTAAGAGPRVRRNASPPESALAAPLPDSGARGPPPRPSRVASWASPSPTPRCGARPGRVGLLKKEGENGLAVSR